MEYLKDQFLVHYCFLFVLMTFIEITMDMDIFVLFIDSGIKM